MRLQRTRVLLLAAAAIGIVACESDTTEPPIAAGSAVINLDITTNRTLYAETTYTLSGFVHVTNGATLTINPGTTIKGDYNTLGSSLFIMRGAKIRAVGTVDKPIVFTSSQPVGSRQPGDWGGLILVGNGVDNRTGTIEIEGTGTATGTASGTNYKVIYTGDAGAVPNNVDDSGELRYVRVEFAGYAPSLNNELNSFSFGAVGSLTKLSYLESNAGLDDAYEFWGGAVDADHLVAYETADDHFDMSEGFKGRLQYLIGFNSTVLTQRTGAGSPSSDPEGIENDGCAGTGCTTGFNTTPYTMPVVANFTIVGTGSTATSGTSGGIGMMLRRGTGGYYVNGIIAKYPRAGISLRDAETYARAGSVATPDLNTADLAVRNILLLETPTTFDPQVAGSATVQNTFDLAGNSITNNTTVTAAQLFTAIPATTSATTSAANFDWTPVAGSPAASGLATFSGKLATAAATPLASGNGTVSGTSFMGAAQPGGTKWWAGWTIYAQK